MERYLWLTGNIWVKEHQFCIRVCRERKGGNEFTFHQMSAVLDSDYLTPCFLDKYKTDRLVFISISQKDKSDEKMSFS